MFWISRLFYSKCLFLCWNGLFFRNQNWYWNEKVEIFTIEVIFEFWKLLSDQWAISRREKWNNDAASVKVGTRRKWIRGQMDSGLKFQKISKINSSIIITGDTGATIMTSWSIFRIWSDHLPKRSSPPILIIFANFTHSFLSYIKFLS